MLKGEEIDTAGWIRQQVMCVGVLLVATVIAALADQLLVAFLLALCLLPATTALLAHMIEYVNGDL